MTTSAWFMGTPDPAVVALHALASTVDVGLVVTRPDRPRGRSRRLSSPPVKVAADEAGLEVIQPVSSTELVAMLRGRPVPDIGVVVAFGMILPGEVLEIPRRGFLNVHFSLLPRWRGAAPVQRALMSGDATTGVTIMEMDEGLDTGPVVAAEEVEIRPAETGGELTARLATHGARLLTETLPAWLDGTRKSRPQPDEGVTYAARIEAGDRVVHTDERVVDAINLVRALAPEPGAQLEIDGVPHKLLELGPGTTGVAPMRWAEADDVPEVGFADGAAAVLSIQPPGGRPMPGEAWLRGRSLPAEAGRRGERPGG